MSTELKKTNDEEKPLLDPEIGKLSLQYFDLEATILERIEKLPAYGQDCDCDNIVKFAVLDVDNVLCYCLNCGGTIYW